MELIIFLLTILFLAIIDSLIIVYINSKFNQKLSLLKKEKQEIENNYQKLRQEIINLQKSLKEQQNLLIQKQQEQEKLQKTQEQLEKNITDPIAYIRRKKLVPEKEIKRAEEYVKKTAANLSIFDALLLLGVLDEEKVTYIKKHIGREE